MTQLRPDLAIIAAMNAHIGRLKTELAANQAAATSAQAALAVESAAYSSYRAATAAVNQQLTAQIQANTATAEALSAALINHPDWAAADLPPEIAATLNQGRQK